MKEINQIKITRIATVLQSLPGNNVVGEQEGIAFVEQMHNFGKELMEIIFDEINTKSGEIKCQTQESEQKK
jgi:hypothetical protein